MSEGVPRCGHYVFPSCPCVVASELILLGKCWPLVLIQNEHHRISKFNLLVSLQQPTSLLPKIKYSNFGVGKEGDCQLRR